MLLPDPQQDFVQPDQLYHYTSLDGFLGILTSRSIWATSIHHLNDAQEFIHARHLAQHEIEERLQREVSRQQRQFLQLLSARLEQIRGQHVFVASFSQVDDLLSQWRGYCPAGKGVSVGFSTAVLRKRAKAQGVRLVRAIYDIEKQRHEISETVGRMLRDRTARVADDDALSHYFGHNIAALSPLLKHSTFAEEREWRLVSEVALIDHPQLRLRTAQSRIIPFFEFLLVEPSEPLRLRDLKIGPNPLPELALDGISAALQVTKTTARAVSLSAVPFRSW